MAAPNRAGLALPFALSWASDGDMSGGGVVRAQGPGAARVRGTLDSTDIYAVLHAALFPLQQR
jgi:alkaline phosphatase